MRRALVVAIGFAICLAVTVAAPVESAVATSCARPSPFGPDTAFTSERAVPTLSQAAAQVAFRPRLPKGEPYRIYVGIDKGVSTRSLVVVYTLKDGRWLRVTQQPIGDSSIPWEEFVHGIGSASSAPCLRSASEVTSETAASGWS